MTPEQLADEVRAIFIREFPGLDWKTEMNKYLTLLTQARVAAAVAEERDRCCRILAGGDRPWREHVAAIREGKA